MAEKSREVSNIQPLSPEAIERMVEVLVERRGELSAGARQRIKRAVQIRGFRDPLKAPPALLRSSLRDIAASLPGLRILASVWATLHGDLVQSQRRASSTSADPDRPPGGHPKDAEIARWWVAVSSSPEQDLVRHAAVQSPTQCGEPLPSPLDSLLETLSSLPADHPAWAHTEEFVKRVRQISTARQAERAASAVRESLKQELALLKPGTLNPEWARWSVDTCFLDRAEDILERIRRMRQLRDEQQEAFKQLPGLTLAEQTRLLDRLGKLRRSISEIGSELDAFFGQPPDSKPPASGLAAGSASGAAPIAESDAAGQPPDRTGMEPGVMGATDGVGTEETLAESVRAETGDREDVDLRPVLTTTTAATPELTIQNHLARLLSRETDGLDTAYWYARSLEALGVNRPLPSSLLAVCAGAYWLLLWPELAASSFMNDLHATIAEVRSQPGIGDPWHTAYLRLAAALPLSLFHPETGLFDWLEPPGDLPAPTRELVEKIREYCVTVGQPPRFPGADRPVENVEDKIREHVAYVRNWYTQALNRKISPYMPACRVFWELLRKEDTGNTPSKRRGTADNLFYMCLAPVIEDRRDEASGVLGRLKHVEDQTAFDTLVQRINLRLSQKHSPREIEAKALQGLRGEAQAISGLVRRWVELIETRKRLRDIREDWVVEQSRRLADRLSPDQLQAALQPLMARQTSADPLTTATGALLARVLGLLPQRLRGERTPTMPRPTCLKQGLLAGLAFRLLLQADIPLKASASGLPEPAPESWDWLRRALQEESFERPSDIRAALCRRLELGDLRWSLWLFDELELPPGDELRTSLDHACEQRERLADRIEVATRDVEFGTMEGYVQPEERADLLGRIETVRHALESNSPSSQTGDADLRARLERCQLPLRGLEERLNEVSTRLEELRERTIEYHRQQWARLRPSLERLLSPDELRQVDGMVHEALGGRHTILLNELVASAKDAVAKGLPDRLTRFGKETAEAAGGTQRLRQFLQAREQICRLLDTGDLRQALEMARGGRLTEALGQTRVDRSAVEQFGMAISAWESLRAATARGDQQINPSDLVAVLNFIGLPTTGSQAVRRVGGARGWFLYEIDRIARAPVPEFGSESQHLNVLIFGERPSRETVESFLAQAGLSTHESAFVAIFLCNLGDALPGDLARWAYRNRVPWLPVDESLLVYLASERDRLTALFSCALPFSGVNPYRPDHEVNLPPEMFVGRETQVRQLLDEAGPTYVYGGRKLGKSSLLGQVLRRFRRPSEKRYAFILSLRAMMTHPDPDGVWSQMATRLTEELPLRPGSDPRQIADHLAKLLRRDRDVRVLVLLDEADAFLELDAQRNFPNVSRLQTLMHESERRFRVIFAGLHTVRRFQRMPNHPLVGQSLAVGPLGPQEARELLQAKMALLGIDLEEPAMLHLMALTNYHAALLQILGQRIVETARGAQGRFPFTVTYRDIEGISRDPGVQDTIRERFKLTLALDPHYEILVLGMVLDQLQTPDGFSAAYSPEGLREIGERHWPGGFGSMTLQQIRDYADELSEMAVLSASDAQGYRLRTPNIVRLLGTRGEMEDRIRQLTSRPSEPPAWEELHPLIGSPPVVGPFSLQDLSQIGIGRSGISLVVGSVATGIRHVKEYLEALLKRRPDQAKLSTVDIDAEGMGDLPQGLETEERHVVLVSARNAQAVVLARLMRAARSLTTRNSAQGWIRIILLLDPPTADLWGESLDSVAVDGTIILTPWSAAAVAKALDALELDPGDADSIMSVTSGYHHLVREILGIRRVRRRGVRGVTDDLASRLVPGGDLYGQLGQIFQIDPGSPLGKTALDVARILRPDEVQDRGVLFDVLAEQPGTPAHQVQAHLRALEVRGVLVETGNGIRIPALAHRWLTGLDSNVVAISPDE